MNEINTATSLQGDEVPPRQATPNTRPTLSYVPTDRVLQRKNGMIAGVAGGLADYFDLDTTIVRLVFVALTLLTWPALPLAYVIAWLVIPSEDTSSTPATGPDAEPTAA